MKKSFVLTVYVLMQSLVYAHTYEEVSITCPLDGTQFRTTSDVSGTQVGMGLDLKPLGPIPAPWSLPVCPTDHFVIYKDENQFTEEEKEHLRKYVNSRDYQDLAIDNSSYFLLGKIFEYLNEDIESIANIYLQASWQVEDNPSKYRIYARECLKKLEEFISTHNQKDDAWITSNLVIGELYRRMKEFDAAKEHFTKLVKMQEFNKGMASKIIQYQLQLIEKKDHQPHAIPYEKTN